MKIIRYCYCCGYVFECEPVNGMVPQVCVGCWENVKPVEIERAETNGKS